MKKLVFTALVVMIGLFPTSSALCKSFPKELNGTMMPYDFSKGDTVVPWGEDMEPVFLNYVARHGARFLSSEKKVAGLKKELQKASGEGYLSEKGGQFLRVLQMVDSVTAGNWGALNSVGISEEKLLGREMASIAPELLKKGRIDAVSTYVPRVVMTMYELCHELARYSSDLEINTSEGRENNLLLRFFNTDSAYVAYLSDGAWKTDYDAFSRKHLPAAPAQSMFSKPMPEERMRKLTLEMYDVLQSLPAAELPWTPEIWFSEEEYRDCWEVDNLKHYYQRSGDIRFRLPQESAAPLLRDIMTSTDDILAAGESDNDNRTIRQVGRLRFGHAETVMPLFSLMRLPGCYLPESSADRVACGWKDWEVSPLGANLLIVVLKDREGAAFISMRLNGKWVEKNGRKVFPWKDVKEEWENYLRL